MEPAIYTTGAIGSSDTSTIRASGGPSIALSHAGSWPFCSACRKRATAASVCATTSSGATANAARTRVARLRGAPEIDIEDGRQLCGCRQRQQLTAVLKSEVRDREMQDFGRQVWHRKRQLRIGSNSGEDVGAGAVLWHGPVMIPAVGCKKQS